MKKLVVGIIFAIILVSFVLAESENMVQQQRNAIKNYTGNNGNGNGNGNSNIEDGNYILENGEEVQVQLQTNNRFRLRNNDSSAECEETCNLTQERDQNKTKLKMQLSNGRNAEIKIMPSTASETALARLRLRVCNETNNCTIQLKEVGKGNETKAGYEIQIQRHFKLLGMFRTKAQVKAQVDAENGELIQVKKPWWAFLASEVEEDSDVEDNLNETETPDNETEVSENETETLDNETNSNETD